MRNIKFLVVSAIILSLLCSSIPAMNEQGKIDILDDWELVVGNGIGGEPDNRYLWCATVYEVDGEDYLYVGTSSDDDHPLWMIGHGGDPNVYRTNADLPGANDWEDITLPEMKEWCRGFRKMQVYNGNLYMGTHVDPITDVPIQEQGCKLWKHDGTNWEMVITKGFGTVPKCHSVRSMAIFNGYLYVGTSRFVGSSGRLFRSANTDPDGPEDWIDVIPPSIQYPTGGFGIENTGITNLKVFNNRLYASCSGFHAQVWRTKAGVTVPQDINDWEIAYVNPEPLTNIAILGMREFKGQLYVGTVNLDEGCEVWRSDTGAYGDWEWVIKRGSIYYDGPACPKQPREGDNCNCYAWQIQEFDGELYVGTMNSTSVMEPPIDYAGFELWKSESGDRGDWEFASPNGFGNSDNYGVRNMLTYKNYFYVGTAKPFRYQHHPPDENTPGCELWRLGGDIIDNPPDAQYIWHDADGSDPGTVLTFDASWSSDDHGIISYEWDWNNDGTYDDLFYNPYCTHDYGDSQGHTCRLRVTDTIDQTDMIVHEVQANKNALPDEPSNPIPEDDATDIDPDAALLSVAVSDPDEDILEVKFYKKISTGTIGISTENEWNQGTFEETTTDGSGSLILVKDASFYGGGTEDITIYPGYPPLEEDLICHDLVIQSNAVLETKGHTIRVSGTLTNYGTITDSNSGGTGGSSGSGGEGGYSYLPHHDPTSGTPGTDGDPPQQYYQAGDGGDGGAGGSGGGGSYDTSFPIAGLTAGGNGGDGGDGGKGGGYVNIFAYALDNYHIIHADGFPGGSADNGGNGEYVAYDWSILYQDWLRDAASGGGGGGAAGDGGDGGCVEIYYANLINLGDIHAVGGTGGDKGNAGISYCTQLEHDYYYTQHFEPGAEGIDGGGAGGESDVGDHCGPDQAEDGAQGNPGQNSTPLLDPLIPEYEPIGTYYSEVFNIGEVVDWEHTNVEVSTPPGTLVTVAYGEYNAGDWIWHSSLANVPDASTIRLRITLQTSDPFATPEVHSISVFYRKGTLLGTDTTPSGTRAYCFWEDLDPMTTYYWYTVAQDDEYGVHSAIWSFTTGVSNQPPSVPNQPIGRTILYQGFDFSYQTSATDPEGHDIFYCWDWGDNWPEVWLGPYLSGEDAIMPHQWEEIGQYDIQVKAKDDPDGDGDPADGIETAWSPILSVEVRLPGDIDGNEVVDVNDLLLLLGAWGDNPGHPADINGDDCINVNDLLILLAHWSS